VQRPENQERVLEFGFRPGNTEVAIADPIVAGNGVDPAEPQTTLEVPEPPVLVEMLDRWAEQRKSARVLLVIDVSGSMGDPAGPGTRDTKLELAKQAAITALDQFKSEDEVGLRIFSTDLGTGDDGEPLDYVDLVGFGEMDEGHRAELTASIESLIPISGTPLYTVTQASYADMLENFAPDRINAMVVLSDGRNDDPRNSDLQGLLSALGSRAEGQTTQPVRVFPIAYGGDADLGILRQIAEATNAAAYDASDPASIDKVFTAVVSNF